MSVWDEIRQKAAEAITNYKGDLRNVSIFIPHAKEAEMLKPPEGEDPTIARRIRYYGVRGAYDQMYGMLMIYDAPTFCVKNGPSWTQDEKALVETTWAEREAAYDKAARLQAYKEQEAARQVAAELRRGQPDKGGEGLVGATH